MDCQELNNQIFDYCDDSVSPQVYLKVSKHLKECHDCQEIYQLTRLENEVLRDTSDIPELPADFTPRIMEAVGQFNQGAAPLRNRKLWYGGVLAVAAVIALCIYAPQYFANNNYANVADNSGSRGDNGVAPYVVSMKESGSADNQSSINEAGQSATPAVNPDLLPADSNKTDTSLPDTASNPAVMGLKSTPADSAPLTTESPEAAALTDRSPASIPGARILTAPDPTAVNNTVTENLEPVPTPVNVPENLQLQQVDITSNIKTVYDYASLDGQIRVKIIVEPFVEPADQNQSLTETRASGINALSRWILVDDQMKTVTYTGNISMDELNNLANAIQFK